ncbi:MAG: hypothetical protein FJ102_07210 [Deltaproteobacteria bacterium]|nr:hypothetical protein [Deltaproteobacteria bacterium]
MTGDDRLRDRWARAPREVAPGCPAPDRLYSAASGELSATEVSKIVDHLRACGACSEDWRLAREVHGPIAGNVVAGPRHWWVAAAVALPLAALALFTLRGEPLDDPMRAVAEPGASTALVAEGATLPRQAFTLEWSAGPAGTWYILTVTDRNLTLLYASGPIETTSHLVPAEELRGAEPGEELFWQVESLLPDGRHARSSTYGVVVQ